MTLNIVQFVSKESRYLAYKFYTLSCVYIAAFLTISASRFLFFCRLFHKRHMRIIHSLSLFALLNCIISLNKFFALLYCIIFVLKQVLFYNMTSSQTNSFMKYDMIDFREEDNTHSCNIASSQSSS